MIESSNQNWLDAIRSFETSIKINQQYELAWDEAKANFEMANMLLGTGQPEKIKMAREKLSTASQIYQNIEAEKDQETVLEKIYKIEHIQPSSDPIRQI